jgi:hypothetical protein
MLVLRFAKEPSSTAAAAVGTGGLLALFVVPCRGAMGIAGGYGA